MSKNLEVPKELEKLIEKREREDRRKKAKAAQAASRVPERRKSKRRDEDR